MLKENLSFYVITLLISMMITFDSTQSLAQSGKEAVLTIIKTEDFTITGDGSANQWSNAKFIELSQVPNQENREGLKTKVKIMYSNTGIYFFFQCDDELISATIDSHFQELWREDVIEVFLWPDERETVYFEYEISPLNYELPILVANNQGEQSHWIPFDYTYKEGRRKVQHKTSVTGGKKESGDAITEWRAEFFIPFELLRPLNNIFPESGTRWRANMYRIDYDKGKTNWVWQPIERNFHDFENFGTFLFE
ncbi:MAG: carbohydrate-binding family 9-like protein [Balneolales bacterium]